MKLRCYLSKGLLSFPTANKENSSKSADSFLYYFRIAFVFLSFNLSLHDTAFAADYETLSPIEKEMANKALVQFNLEVETNPQNKRIGRFFYYTETPFNKGEGKFLNWFNNLHIPTLDSTFENRIQLSSGDVYNPILITQAEQTLLDPWVRSIIFILPVSVRGQPDEDRVHLLVVSRDILGIQITFSVSGTSQSLEQFYLSLAQTNLGGLNKTLALVSQLNQYTLECGSFFEDKNLFNSGHGLYAEQRVLLNRSHFRYEGVKGSFLFYYPLSIATTEWGYQMQLNHALQPQVAFTGNNIRLYQIPNSSEMVERKYRQLSINGSATLTRSFGKSVKNNFTSGYGFSSANPSVFEDFPLTGAAADEFIKNVLPHKEFQSYVILGYDYFHNRFGLLHNYNTFYLSEPVRLGPFFSIATHLAAGGLFSDANFIRPLATAGFVFSPFRASLLELSLSGQTRLQEMTAINNLIQINFTAISAPVFKAGRFVLAGLGSSWLYDRDNHVLTLGGDNALRGIGANYYGGPHFIRTNLEFRSISLPFWAFRVGGVAFYDFGAAFDSFSHFFPTHSVGIGTRILFIPNSRNLIRIDVGVPVEGPKRGIQNTLVTFGVGQAF